MTTTTEQAVVSEDPPVGRPDTTDPQPPTTTSDEPPSTTTPEPSATGLIALGEPCPVEGVIAIAVGSIRCICIPDQYGTTRWAAVGRSPVTSPGG